jgi:hypothetical protein
MSRLPDLLQSGQFGAGLAAGVAAAALLLLVVACHASWLRRRTVDPHGRTAQLPADRRPPGGVGVAFTLATLSAIAWFGPSGTISVPAGLTAGLAALWVAGAISARIGEYRVLAGIVLGLPGGLLLAEASGGAPGWAVLLLVIGPGLAGSLAADLDDRQSRSGTATLAFALALGGMYGTVPDTELTRFALGAAAPVVLLAWPFPLARLGRGGALAAVGLFLWIATVDGAARPGSIVGAAACLGVLVVEPVGRWWASRGDDGTRCAPAPVVIAVQLVVVYFCSRIAGFQQNGAAAALLAVPALAVAGAVLAAIARNDRPSPPGDGGGSAPRRSPPGPRRRRRRRRSRRSRPVPSVIPDRPPPPRAR